MQVVVDNLLTSYVELGKGPVVLLLHGWGDDLKTFQKLQAKLSQSYRAVALDLPGFGQTQMPATVWNLDNYAQFVSKFLEKIAVSDLHAVVGHSNGGALAIRGISKGTLRAHKLILLASAGVRSGQPLKRLVIKIIAKVGKIVTFWLPRSYKQRFRKKLYGVAGSDMLVAPHLEETFKITVRQDIQEDARSLSLPTLLIYGEKDEAVPLADGKKLAGLIANSKWLQLPEADHFLHQTASEQVGEAVAEFLKT